LKLNCVMKRVHAEDPVAVLGCHSTIKLSKLSLMVDRDSLQTTDMLSKSTLAPNSLKREPKRSKTSRPTIMTNSIPFATEPWLDSFRINNRGALWPTTTWSASTGSRRHLTTQAMKSPRLNPRSKLRTMAPPISHFCS